jgi:hypothetical protein
LIQGLPLLLGFFLISATLFGLPPVESNFTVDEFGKRHYVLVPEKTPPSFLEELSAKVSGRYGSEQKIFDYNTRVIDSQSFLLLPFASGLFFSEQGPDGITKTVDSIVDFEFNSSFKIIEDDSDFTILGNSEEETVFDTTVSFERVKISADYNFKQLQIGGH